MLCRRVITSRARSAPACPAVSAGGRSDRWPSGSTRASERAAPPALRAMAPAPTAPLPPPTISPVL